MSTVRPPPGAALGALAVLAVLGCLPERQATPAAERAHRANEERLAVMAPAAAEMLGALGLAPRVVAVGDFVGWPPDLAALPRIGAYDRPSLERPVELDVDLYVTARSTAGSAARLDLERLGIEVLELETGTYEGTLAALAALGERLGRAPEARALAEAIRARVEAVRSRARTAPPRRVLVVVGRDPLYVAGPGSHLDELLDAAGGRNVAADALSPYQLLSLEAALARRPEVIVDSSDNRPGALRGRALGPWAEWPFLPAVAERRVYWVDPARLSIPGPRLGEMAELLARIVHPERFGEPRPGELGALESP
jgi:ABC-type Fe3+-hydroxamate transport system substrate-binding protein